MTGIPAPAASFTIGPVTCPKGLSCVYVHSDKLAGARDTVGPVPGQRATIAKISLGTTGAGEHQAESLYRPHLYTTLSRQDIDIIDFKGLKYHKNNIEIPHPRLSERNFVLVPLYEIEKTWKHPKNNISIDNLLKKLNFKSLRGIKIFERS